MQWDTWGQTSTISAIKWIGKQCQGKINIAWRKMGVGVDGLLCRFWKRQLDVPKASEIDAAGSIVDLTSKCMECSLISRQMHLLISTIIAVIWGFISGTKWGGQEKEIDIPEITEQEFL